MDHLNFESQVDRLAKFFRAKGLSPDQKTEWWNQLNRQDPEDLSRAVDQLIAEGSMGRMPTIRQVQACCFQYRATRKQAAEAYQEQTMETVPVNSEFAAGCRRNICRLMGPILIDSDGKILKPDPSGKVPAGAVLKSQLTYDQGIENLYALADKHGSDPAHWAYNPVKDKTENRRLMNLTGQAKLHMDRPSRFHAPDKLGDLNEWWLENVFQPAVKESLEGGR